jgi:hypothetical protein
MATIHLRNLDNLISAVPALLGCLPTDSIVVVSLREDCTVGPVFRVDAVVDLYAADRIAARLLDEQIPRAVVVAATNGRNSSLVAAEGIAESLMSSGVIIEESIRVSGFISGSRWRSSVTGRTGTVNSRNSARETVERRSSGATTAA